MQVRMLEVSLQNRTIVVEKKIYLDLIQKGDTNVKTKKITKGQQFANITNV